MKGKNAKKILEKQMLCLVGGVQVCYDYEVIEYVL
jgi:hypothetical protein